jgi:hypothetical protein
VPNGLGGFNRFYTRTDASPITLNYVFNSCQTGGVITEIANQSIVEAILAPNPAIEGFSINQLGDQKYRIDVMDVSGRIKKTLTTSGTSIYLERAELSSGMYYVSITADDGVQIFRKVLFR